jgi:hypothetical protein
LRNALEFGRRMAGSPLTCNDSLVSAWWEMLDAANQGVSWHGDTGDLLVSGIADV